ncbi:MAG TPA: hypothetical protein VGF43_01165 [Dongiaceae bacterium]|jgi:threonine dehydrogenase-like Zn-dependent dehydrogenase
MKAVVFRGIGDIRLEDVAEPRIEQPTDVIGASDRRDPGWIKVELAPARAPE